MTRDEATEAREERALMWGTRGGLLSVLQKLDQFRDRQGDIDGWRDLDGWALLESWLRERVIIQTRMLEQSKRLGFITEHPEPPFLNDAKVHHILKRLEEDGELRLRVAEYMATCSDIHEAEQQMASAVAVNLGAPDTPPLEETPT